MDENQQSKKVKSSAKGGRAKKPLPKVKAFKNSANFQNAQGGQGADEQGKPANGGGWTGFGGGFC